MNINLDVLFVFWKREKEGRVVRLCLTGLTGSSARGESLGWSALIKLSLNCGQAGPGTAQTRKYKYFHIRVRVKSQDRHKLLIRVQPCPGPSLYFTTD